jgi:hypothetical protein
LVEGSNPSGPTVVELKFELHHVALEAWRRVERGLVDVRRTDVDATEVGRIVVVEGRVGD